jgi:hypothetical protein
MIDFEENHNLILFGPLAGQRAIFAGEFFQPKTLRTIREMRHHFGFPETVALLRRQPHQRLPHVSYNELNWS